MNSPIPAPAPVSPNVNAAAQAAPTLADIFRLYGEAYQQEHRLSLQQLKAMEAIQACQTEALGSHLKVCADCGYQEAAFNSCRNRHCHRCLWFAQRRWLEDREAELLEVPYYHVVFTLPHYFFSFGLFNQERLYTLLMDASAETLKQFARDPQHLGAQSGFFGVLHTWGQTLWFHPHVHYVVAGGGLSQDGRHWIPARRGEKFLYPVQALSQVFRGKFIEKLKAAYSQGKLKFPEALDLCLEERGFESWLDGAVVRPWVVYAKRPFAGPAQVLKYLSQYTHRAAISKSRLLSLADGRVEFAYKDYKDPARLHKTMKLSAHDFIQRFLFHVLPAGFHRIRYYGFLANGKRTQHLARIRALLVPPRAPQDARQEPRKETPFRCPLCAGEHFQSTPTVQDSQTLSWKRNPLSWRATQGDGL